jgi:hypothetical protein
MNDDFAFLMWILLTNTATYFYCKYHFIEFTIDILEEKGLLTLEDDEK